MNVSDPSAPFRVIQTNPILNHDTCRETSLIRYEFAAKLCLLTQS